MLKPSSEAFPVTKQGDECMHAQSFSGIWLFATPWTVAQQAPLSMGFSLARILEWVATSFSRGSSQPRDWTWISHIAGGFFTILATRKALRAWIKTSYLFLTILWWSCEFQGKIRANHATLKLGQDTQEKTLSEENLSRKEISEAVPRLLYSTKSQF